MGDVYVEVGEVKGKVDKKYLSNAQAGMKAAITEAVNKAKSGMTTVKPGGGKGIRVNIVVKTLAQDGDKVTCSLIGELKELPGGQAFNPKVSAAGEGTVPGKIEAVAADCVKKAVADMMAKVGSAIANSQAAPAATGTASSKSPLIFIVLDVSYPKDAKLAQQDLKEKAVAAVTASAKAKVGENPERLTLDASKFKDGSGMPAYKIQLTVDKFVYDDKAKEMVAKVNGMVLEYAGDTMRVPSLGAATSKMDQITRPPKEAEQILRLKEATDVVAGKATKWILEQHP